jgi:hypothetical protein
MTTDDKINRIYETLVGTELNPHGLIERVEKLEKRDSEIKKFQWIAVGGAAVVSFIISLYK